MTNADKDSKRVVLYQHLDFLRGLILSEDPGWIGTRESYTWDQTVVLLVHMAAWIYRHEANDFEEPGEYSTSENTFLRLAEDRWFEIDALLRADEDSQPLSNQSDRPETQSDIPGKDHHVVYRLWDEDDLLYVGRSSNLRVRLKAHRRRWGESFELTWVEYETRQEAILAEAEAIRIEDPLDNLAGVIRGPAR